MSEISEDIFKPKFKETCSFEEALKLLAFGDYPVDDESLLDKVGTKYFRFYYDVDYLHSTSDKNSKDTCLKYDKNSKKYYIDVPYLKYIIETSEELEYYRELQRCLAIMKNIIASKPSEMKISYFTYDATNESVDISAVKQIVTKTMCYGSSHEYRNEVRGIVKNIERSLKIQFKTEYIYKIYKKKVEQKQSKSENVQLPLNNNKVIDDTSYTTPEIQLINAFIRNPENIPLLSQRGDKNKLELKKRLVKLNKELRLVAKLSDNAMKGILSVIKSPEGKKSGNIPTPYGDSI